MSAAEDFECSRQLRRKPAVNNTAKKTHVIFAACPNIDCRYTWGIVTDARIYTMNVKCPKCGAEITVKK